MVTPNKAYQEEKKREIITTTNKQRITTDFVDIKKDYYKRILGTTYYNTADELNKINKFHKTHNLPKLTQEEIENKNSPASIKEIESIISNLLTKKTPETDDFTSEFSRQLRKKQ